jgi:hypothetical protein
MFTASGYADQRHELAVPDVDCRVARGQLRCGSAARHNLLVQLLFFAIVFAIFLDSTGQIFLRLRRTFH